MADEFTIPARFNGPPGSGNGGYSCGLLAAFIDGPARVRLHAPPPLDTPMQLFDTGSGSIEMRDGEVLVGSAAPAPLELEPPTPPSLSQAQEAAGRYPCYVGHNFPTCFVCGPDRPGHDGLELFPGPVHDWSLVACPWQPAADLLDDRGIVRPEFVWAALDCPGYFAAMGDDIRPAVLGELDGELRADVPGSETLVVYAWPMGGEGRKHHAGCAIATVRGAILALSKSTWILLAP